MKLIPKRTISGNGRISIVHMLGVMALIMLFYYIALDIHTSIYGIPQTVTVSFYKKKVLGKPGSGYRTVSFGYYSVKGKRYAAWLTKKVPIGTKFEIKYNPIVPSRYNIQE
jgi:hypothetical protein